LADERRIVDEVARAVGLAEGEPGVRSVLSALARVEPVAIRRLSRVSGLPVPIVASICGELRKRGVVSSARPAQLTARGRELFAGGGLRLPETACPTCSGRGRILPPELAPSVRDAARSARQAPAPRFDLDQCHCTVETKLRRVLAAHEADALVGRRVLLLGDDDLVSLAVESVVRRHGSARTISKLTVLDVDPAVVAFASKGLEKARFPVSCLVHDLRAPLPDALQRAFDTVFTDPPYTPAGARLFLSRAAEALRGEGDVFLSFGSKRPESTFSVQQEMLRLGFSIRALTPDFNRYVGAGALGGSSSLYHLVATSRVRPLVTGEFHQPMYTAEVP
jgi:predicted methyltransferase